MDNLKDLHDLVSKLEKVKDKAEQINILQKINEKLLTEYEIHISEDEILHPLRVEAYYYPDQDPDKFNDCCAHLSPKKKNNFGGLYFIEDRYGYPGIDICLSKGDYYLSFLIKNSYLNSYSLEDPGFRQMDLFERFKNRWEELEAKRDILRKKDVPDGTEPVFKTLRVGLKKEATEFSHELLASLIKIERKNEWFGGFADGFGKLWMVANYLIEHDLKADDETIRRLLGSNSKEVKDIYKKILGEK